MADSPSDETRAGKEDGGIAPQLVLRVAAETGASTAARLDADDGAKSPSRPLSTTTSRARASLVCGLAALVALVVGLAAGLSSKGGDGAAPSPKLQSVLTVDFDARNSILTDINVTSVRCALANASGVPGSSALLVSWTDAGSNTVYPVSASDPLNLGICPGSSGRRILSTAAAGAARLLPSTASAATLARFTVLVNDETIPLATRQVWAQTYGLTIVAVNSESISFTPTPSTTPSAPGAGASSSSTPTPSTTPSAPGAGASSSSTPTPSAPGAGSSSSSTPTPSTTPSAPGAGAS